jgi:hypothetical protein
MSLYTHAETYEKLVVLVAGWDKAIEYYREHSSEINDEWNARKLERKANRARVAERRAIFEAQRANSAQSPIDPCAPVESVIDAEMRAMHEWKQRAEAKRQYPDHLTEEEITEIFGTRFDEKPPFPAVALSGRVMRVGVAYPRD